jgi:hypothetical protein
LAVKKFNGSAWVTVATKSGMQPTYIALAIDSVNQPYVAY